MSSQVPEPSPPALAEPASPVRPSRSRQDRLAASVIAASLAAIALVVGGLLVRVPYVVEQPGGVVDTLGTVGGEQRLVTVDGAPTYPTEGSLYLTTVRVVGDPERHISLWRWLGGHLDRESVVVPEERVFGGVRSEEEVRRANQADMEGSQESAEAVGIRSTGRSVPQRNLVAAVGEGLPATGRLEVGDEIRSVDGERIERIAGLTTAISDRRPGEQVRLGIVRAGRPQTVTLRTADIGDGRAGVGVSLDADYDTPFSVRIDAGRVGGPSAGMMFALAVHDVLTPGALTGGAKVAGTGTIDDSGRVGPIGGIAQKMIGAREAGADWFLAPGANCTAVVGHVPDGLRVVRVDDLDDALASVRAIAEHRADGLPGCG